VADVIADWKTIPGTVGIRIMMTKEAKRNPNDPGLDLGFRPVPLGHGLDSRIRGRQLRAGRRALPQN
jgi:hypothetical protein